MRTSGRWRQALLAILLAGMALRLFRLGAGSLWYDETVSVFLAGSPLPDLLRHTAGDIHPPGYYVLLRAWLVLAGYPAGHADAAGQGLELAAAFFSCCCGVLLIALTYWLARRLGGRTAALAAALLVALSPYNVWYSQEVRMYTLSAALGVLAVGALYRATARATRRRAGWWALYALAAAAGMYTLYYFAFLLLPVNLWALARLWGSRARIGIMGAEAASEQHREMTEVRDLLGAGIQDANWHRTAAPASLAVEQDSVGGPAYPAVARESAGADPTIAPAPRRTSLLASWLLANAAVLLLYAPWLGVAWRQATQPPVPPWRAATGLWTAWRESWTALSLGQSAPGALWPAVLLLLPLYALGLYAVWAAHRPPPAIDAQARRRGAFGQALASPAALLLLATFGALALILLASALAPLYHVRYVFTYSPYFYIALAAGLAWLWPRWRPAVPIIGAAWLAAAALTLNNFWFDARYQPDDHRGAVSWLQAHWRPGDVVLVNAGYAYPALATYWQAAPVAAGGPISATAATRPGSPLAWAGRLTGRLPAPRADALPVVVTTGHVDGGPGLGWGDPRSDFFGMPAGAALDQLQTLFGTYPRVWQYRIYDTVNDPQGALRAGLAADAQLCEDQVWPGEASLRVQAWQARQGAPAMPDWRQASLPALNVQAAPLPAAAPSGETIYPTVQWQPQQPLTVTLATSLRLVAEDGTTWAQPQDERPGGALCGSTQWTPGAWQRQALALPIPPGTPPGNYTVQLIAYDAATGRPLGPWSPTGDLAASPAPPHGLILGRLRVARPLALPARQPAQARFGPLALLEAHTPARQVSPGDSIPIDVTWQAAENPGQAYAEVAQLLDAGGRVVAGLETQPVRGQYSTQDWVQGEIVRDQVSLDVPRGLLAGSYQLIVGLYRARDGQRQRTRTGPFGSSDRYPIAVINIKGAGP